MILLVLVALFVVIPIAELAVIIWVGSEIGVLNTIGLLILDSVLGSLLIRSQGRLAWKRFNEAVAARRPPAREALDGALVIGGGALLLTPGFISDILGALLLLPPTRAIVRKLILWRMGGAMLVSTAESMGRGPRRPGDPPPRQTYDVDSSATEIDP